jgi:hypothetical protein
MACDVNQLLSDGKCFVCLPPRQRAAIKTQLLCEIANAPVPPPEGALPNKADLETMDFAWQAQPFVNVTAKDSIDTDGMDVAWQAQPFIAAPDP